MIRANKWRCINDGLVGILLLFLARPTALTINKFLYPVALLLSASIAFTPVYGQYQMENLSRSVVAVNDGSGKVYIGWRYLGTDPTNIAFNVYRNNTRINASPITNSTNYVDTSGSSNAQYTIREVINGVESGSSESIGVWNDQYLTVDLQRPSGGKTPDGVSYDYSPNDLSVADLDGDSEYEIIVKWDPSNSKDNSQSGYTGNVYLDAYEMSGARLWRIDLGRNIRAGAHYTQFIAYDLDGDGRAEVACKTADATIDGQGTVIGDKNADHRKSNGYILSGPEYLTIFDGKSGRALATTDYVPARGDVSSWGDNYGNRVDRFLAGVAYLDGERPSLIMSRGYYTRAVIAAWDWRNGSLTNRWTFDSNDSGNSAAAGQGAHSLTIGDVDQDGRQEIVYGAATIDDNGRLLYSTGLCHGDALHLGDFDPDRNGLEVFMVHESPSCYGKNAIEMHDARTGSILWSNSGNGDIGRGLTADIDPRYRGSEAWASSGGMNSATGENLGSSRPSINFAVWWDADPLREILDKTVIDKWNIDKSSTDRLLTSYNYGTASNNSTKANPGLTADLFGDWREEVIWRSDNNTQLLIFTTTDVTDMRQFTLMHDPQYRVAVAWQNAGYNQPPHPGFYLGGGMSTPPQPDIKVVGGSNDSTPPSDTNPPNDSNNSGGVTIEENTTGYCGVDGWVESNNTGFTGSGFANTNNESSSGVDWEVSVPDNGSYTLSWRYANGSSSNRTGQVMVDGRTLVSSVNFQSTGLWSSWNSTSTDVTLNAGTHRIRLQASMSEGLANIDNLTIGGNNPQAADCNGNSDSSATLNPNNSGSVAVTLKTIGGDGKVDLSWTVTGDLANIQVYRDTDADPDGRGRIAILPGEVRSYTDNAVVDGQQYWYWIKYTDTDSQMGNSNAGSATPSSNSSNDNTAAVSTSEFCAMAEENNSLTLNCPSGNVITGVNFASYGTPGGSCGSFSTGSCNASNSVSVVSDACKGKASCTLNVSNETFGDPCYGTVKKLAAQVACGMSTDSGDTPNVPDDNPSDTPNVPDNNTGVASLKTLAAFPIGNAVNAGDGADNIINSGTSAQQQAIIFTHFNQMTAGNDMKMSYLHPSENTFTFDKADTFISFANANGIDVHGHTLIWHSDYQVPSFMKNYNGDFAAMLKKHVQTIVSHYSGKVVSWDVVNEALADNGESGAVNGFRNSVFYQKMGVDYIDQAFINARAVDPVADLFYNDYSIENGDAKTDNMLSLIDGLKARGVPITGVGFQMHVLTSWPNISVIEKAMKAVADRGLKVKITELDVRVNNQYDSSAPVYTSLTDEAATNQKERYRQIVAAYLRAVPPAQRAGITVWGVWDTNSWLNTPDHPDWPLLFDENFQAKPALQGFADGLTGN